MSLAELGDIPGKVETLQQPGRYVADPLAAFTHLCHQQPNALLLESAEIESKDDLKSLLMVDAALRLECRGNNITIDALSDNGASLLPLIVEHCPAAISCQQRTGGRAYFDMRSARRCLG